jgi:hypothetical protein
VLAVGVIKALYPAITPADAADIIVPHHDRAGVGCGLRRARRRVAVGGPPALIS